MWFRWGPQEESSWLRWFPDIFCRATMGSTFVVLNEIYQELWDGFDYRCPGPPSHPNMLTSGSKKIKMAMDKIPNWRIQNTSPQINGWHHTVYDLARGTFVIKYTETLAWLWTVSLVLSMSKKEDLHAIWTLKEQEKLQEECLQQIKALSVIF